jgi:hypothetical protein
MTTISPPLKNSKIFDWELYRASHENPVKALLKTAPKKNNFGANTIAILFAIFGAIVLAISILTFYYVNTKTSPLVVANGIVEPSITGVIVAKNNIQPDVDLHVLCTASLTVTLKDPTILDFGRFTSVSLPMPLSSPVSDGRTVTVSWTNPGESTKTYTLLANKGALFLVANELNQKKWKLIREW